MVILREWLLKDEKAKVGRPKLANEELIKKSYILIAICTIICVIMSGAFFCVIKNLTPYDFLYKLVGSKLNGIVTNKDGFITKEYYNKNHDYVMEFKVPDSVKKYSGSYKYTTYYLKNNKWIENDTKDVEKNKDEFKITFESLKNENRTWKVKLQIVNSSGTTKSFAPYSWSFVDSDKMKDKYAYKIFTVKGYYSPVGIDEVKELKKSKEKISVVTDRNDPREFILNVPNNTYSVKVSYVDKSNKNTEVLNKKDISGKISFNIPNFDYSVKVIVKVFPNNVGIKDAKRFSLSNWTISENKDKRVYITNTYILKPELSYKN